MGFSDIFNFENIEKGQNKNYNSFQKKKPKEKEELKNLKTLWCKAYQQITGRVIILSDMEVSLLKKLLKTYKYEEIVDMMEYYFLNYKNLGFIKSKELPKIRLFYYFREDFYEHAVKNK